MQTRWITVLALTCLQACNATVHVTPRPVTTHAEASADAVASTVHFVAASEPTRSVGDLTNVTTLTGKVKLLSEAGSGIISNNTGSLISDAGGNLISDAGGNVVSEHGGALISNNGSSFNARTTMYKLAATATPDEASLANAQIEVMDGAGKRLVDAAGKPITATSDALGNYTLKAALPAENLVLRVRLYNGGQLFALAIHQAGATTATLDLDTASSLGASYVLQKYVLNQPNVYARMPADQAAGLVTDMETARKLLTKPPTFLPADQVALTEGLRAKAPALDQRLTAIMAILLVGQADNGEGLQATQVGLAIPYGITGDAKGNVYIAESGAGRVRIVDSTGAIKRYAGAYSLALNNEGDPRLKTSFASPHAIAAGPDGSIYVADTLGNSVRKIGADGNVTTVAGTGKKGQGPTPGKATAVDLDCPTGLTVAADGTIYIVEYPDLAVLGGRVLKLATDGTLTEVISPPFTAADTLAGNSGHDLTGVAVGPDGALYCIDPNTGGLYGMPPGKPWSVLVPSTGALAEADVTVGADGTVYYSADGKHQVFSLAPGATQPTLLAGTGQVGNSGDGGPAAQALLGNPDGLWLSPANKLYVTDAGNDVVRVIDLSTPAHTIETFAGATGISQQGDALNLSVNVPAGIAFDAQGRLVVAEAASNTIKVLDGTTLRVIAGAVGAQSTADGLPATQTAILNPSGLAYDAAGNLYYGEAAGYRIRRVGLDGTVKTLVGVGTHSHGARPRLQNALEATLARVIAVAISPTDGRLYWTDNENNQLERLNTDGNVEIIAGNLDGSPTLPADPTAGDGAPAASSALAAPAGLAFDAKGVLYLADTGDMRIRKITGLDTAAPQIDEVAGVPLFSVLSQLAGGTSLPLSGPAATAALIGPLGVCVDASGDIYFSEAGTARLKSLIGTVGGDTGDLNFSPIAPRIRKLTPDGQLTTITGPGTSQLSDPLQDNALILPFGVALDPRGRLIIADGGNNQITALAKGSF